VLWQLLSHLIGLMEVAMIYYWIMRNIYRCRIGKYLFRFSGKNSDEDLKKAMEVVERIASFVKPTASRAFGTSLNREDSIFGKFNFLRDLFFVDK